MPVHLPDENYITYNASADMSQVVSQEFLRKTMLTEWFLINQMYPEARDFCIVISHQGGDGMIKQEHGKNIIERVER
jgi:hypothetical protein